MNIQATKKIVGPGSFIGDKAWQWDTGLGMGNGTWVSGWGFERGVVWDGWGWVDVWGAVVDIGERAIGVLCAPGARGQEGRRPVRGRVSC